MLHDAAQGNFPDCIAGNRELPRRLLHGRVQVFVWVTLRQNLTWGHKLFSRSVSATERPDHTCITLVAEDGWRYSLGFMYSGGATPEGGLARLLTPPGDSNPAHSIHAFSLRLRRSLSHNISSYAAKIVSPDWLLSEALVNILAQRKGEPTPPDTATGVQLVGVGYLSDAGRHLFGNLLLSSETVQHKTRSGYDVANERLLGRYRALVKCNSTLRSNCASFISNILPDLVNCRSLVTGLALPVSCRPVQSQRARCRRKNASHTEIEPAEEPHPKRRKLFGPASARQ